MAYKIQYLKRAKEELERCCSFYAGLEESSSDWIRSIANSIEEPTKDSATFDLDEILKDAAEDLADDPSQAASGWRRTWTEWKKAGLLTKFRAIYTALKTRKPPWTLSMSAGWLLLIDGVPKVEVHAYYAIDRVNKTITFIKFDGLPLSKKRR